VGFEGDKLTVISEFAVKTVLEKFKMAIEKEAILMMRLLAIDLEYTLLLTTLNIRCTFLMLQRTVKQRTVPRRYNNILYFKKWMSEISEGNKFSMAIGSGTYTTGFYDSARAGIWKEDELTDPVTGKFIRARLRGVDYEYGFEIVLNKEPA
jgi:hypothetical protein